MSKSKARLEAENSFYELLDTFDKGGYNSDMYRKLFNTMSDVDFTAYMQRLANEEEYASIELDTAKRELTLETIFEGAKKLNIRTHKYVIYKHNSQDGIESVTPHPALILYMPIKRLQQMVSKKNSASSNTDKVNPLTGTVTSDSKSAGISDTQTFGLITTGQKNTIKELLGPRADDDKSKKQMLHRIEEEGYVKLSELHIHPKNKQATQTMKVFLRGVGIDVTVD